MEHGSRARLDGRDGWYRIIMEGVGNGCTCSRQRDEEAWRLYSVSFEHVVALYESQITGPGG